MKRFISTLLIVLMLFQSLSYAEPTVTANEIVLLLNSSNALVNGDKVKIDMNNENLVPIIIDSRTYLPVRFIAESLGVVVGWDSSTEEVTISLDGNVIRTKIGSTLATVNG